MRLPVRSKHAVHSTASTLTALLLAFGSSSSARDVAYRYVGYGETVIPTTDDREYAFNGSFSLDSTRFGETQTLLDGYRFSGPSNFESPSVIPTRTNVLTDPVGNILSMDVSLGGVDEEYQITENDWVYAATDFFGGVVRQVESVRVPVVERVPSPTAGNVTLDWVAVGDPRNPAYLNQGRVNQGYRIGKHEVTNAQYAAFLNRKAQFTFSDALGLYDEQMFTDPRGGILQDGEGVGLQPYRYRVKPFMGDKPVNFVGFYDALRFTNWLHNGQGRSSTEEGAYTLLGGTEIPTNIEDIERNPDAQFYLPNQHEWFKAGYYEPGASGNSYWRYATRSDEEPTAATANTVGDISNRGRNVVNYDRGADWNRLNGNVTTVASAGPLSESFYGAADMNGNVWEWTEETSSLTDAFRNVYGGSYFDPTIMTIPEAGRDTRLEATANTGFRVAAKGLGLTGDFNLDNRFTVLDIDLLNTEVLAGPYVEMYDVNGDDTLSTEDRDDWLEFIGRVRPGDSDFDSTVAFADFLILSANFGKVGGWARGDFDGDGSVQFADFLILSAHYGETTRAAVPESSTAQTVMIGCLSLLYLRQRRRPVAP